MEGAKHPFVVLMDHQNLSYLHSSKKLNPRQASWVLYLTCINFKVTYCPYSRNIKADALSHQYEYPQQHHTEVHIIPPTMIIALVQWDIMTEIADTQTHHPPPPDMHTHHPQPHTPDKTYVLPSIHKIVIPWVHSSLSSGHPGITAILQLVINRFWWPTMQADTITYICDCSTCKIGKSPKQPPARLLQPLPTPQFPWSHIAIDFVMVPFPQV